jgi:Zn-dependent protease
MELGEVLAKLAELPDSAGCAVADVEEQDQRTHPEELPEAELTSGARGKGDVGDGTIEQVFGAPRLFHRMSSPWLDPRKGFADSLPDRVSHRPGAPRVGFDPDIILVFPVFVLSIVVHECAHGLVALWNGDPTARDAGRLTLNPIPHIDPIGSVVLPALLLLFRSPIVFGWAKPVPIQWANLRRPRDDQVKVALAGPASNFLLAIGFAALTRVAPEEGFWSALRVMGYAGVLWNCALGLFNLLPIPPLDGSWLLMRFLPLRHIIALQHFRLLGLLLVVLLMSSPAVSRVVLIAPLRFTVNACLGLFGVEKVML